MGESSVINSMLVANGNGNFFKTQSLNGTVASNSHAKADRKILAEEEILLGPFNHIRPLIKSDIRMQVLNLFIDWLNVEVDVQVRVREMIEFLHCASLLLDDIENEKELRQGKPAAHKVFDAAHVINTVNYLYAKALQKCFTPEEAGVFAEQLFDLHMGRGMEIFHKNNFNFPNLTDYKEAVVKKLNGFFMIAIKLLQISSKNKSDLLHLVSKMSLFLQILADYNDLKLMKSEDKTPSNENPHEKLTISLPLLHSIQQYPEDDRVASLFQKQIGNIYFKKAFVTLLEENGSIKYTIETLQTLEEEIRDEVKRLGGNDFILHWLDDIAASYSGDS